MPALSSQLKPQSDGTREPEALPQVLLLTTALGYSFCSQLQTQSSLPGHSLIGTVLPRKKCFHDAERGDGVSEGFMLEGCGSYCFWHKFSKFSQRNGHHWLSGFGSLLQPEMVIAGNFISALSETPLKIFHMFGS